jgi:CBS domain containing-hemolysin-like protein
VNLHLATAAQTVPLAAPVATHATMLEWGAWWVVVILCVLASALCSGMELGVYSVNRVRLDLRAARTPPDTSARILRAELDKPARVLATLLISNNIVNALAAEGSTRLLGMAGHSTLVVAAITTFVLSPVLFIAGDALPKELFRVEADRLVPVLARPLRWVRVLLTLTGVVPLVQVFSTLLERVLKLPADAGGDARQRIALLLKEGVGHGVLSESQVTLVDRALAFHGVRVADEMTPWSDVKVLPLSGERSRLLEIIGTSRHAHFPSVDRSGKVAGVIQQLDLYTQTKKSTQELVITVPRVRPSTPAREALAQLRQKRARLAIVEDASGRPLGIVTAKDLVEPLTGELAGL